MLKQYQTSILFALCGLLFIIAAIADQAFHYLGLALMFIIFAGVFIFKNKN